MSVEPSSPLSSVADLLQQRARTNGAVPLITYDDRTRAERTELSATSFANWVDKTANLLTDELNVEADDVVVSRLALTHPGHWTSLVWTAAVWQIGATLALPGVADDEARLLVVGPEDLAGVGTGTGSGPGSGTSTVACSLHPLGLGFATALPDGVLDYAEVRTQPDAYLGDPAPSDHLAWWDAERRLRAREVVASAVSSDPVRDGRWLVLPSDPWSTVRDGLVVPLATDGSAVIAVGADAEALESIVRSERVSGRAGA